MRTASDAVAIDPAAVDLAVELAACLQQRARKLQRPEERRQQAELDRMLQTPSDKVTMVQLTDQAFRSRGAARTVEQFTHILDVQGIPRFFSRIDRALLRGFRTFGGWLPGVSVPLVKDHMQQETANVVLPAEPEVLAGHLEARQRDGLRMNVNFLGEALLGEQEAERRLNNYLEALQMPAIEVLSVKISTIYSQINPVAWEHTINTLCDRLERLYREALHLRFRRADGVEVPKFVYLDMEEYRDLHLTAETFMRTLDRPGLEQAVAGIALQAYLPDSWKVQRRLIDWARGRVDRGGAPVTIRLVKGANLEMERVEASQRDWPQAPYRSKHEVDANFKRMLLTALQPDALQAVRVGIASHNLFDVALGLVLAEQAGAGGRVQFEMLEGMANHQRRALFEDNPNLLLYAPACRKEEFLNAIGYLIRRLDENTGPENFLRHTFQLEPGSPDWQRLERGFRDACRDVATVAAEPRRHQNRLTEQQQGAAALVRPGMTLDRFRNEPDTDFALPWQQPWIGSIFNQRPADDLRLPLVIDGEEVLAGRDTRPCTDPSEPGRILARCAQATADDIETAVQCARADADGWRSRPVDQRNDILGRAAAELRAARTTLMWTAMAEGGKTLPESDPEVSEAVDFVEFYRLTSRAFHDHPGVHASPAGVVVVVPPWNFPIAIPCGGVAAALAAGNTVILKPASDVALTAWELCRCFWRAGVPRRALQFVPCQGSGPGARLAAHPQVDAVILTGGTDTAMHMLAARPDLPLVAETGGKNATVVTALSDRELAVKHVVQSAFGHAGQKCSATSLLLLEAEVYDDPEFRRLLGDAAASVRVGSAWDPATRMGPLIRKPEADLEQALLTLEPGESWALMPRRLQGRDNLWTPGIKWGVQPGSVTHLTEFFGPVLGVMRFERLEQAIELVNQTGYGLTSGLHSLDEREHETWRQGIRAGNLYINRGTTGAIVLRQPFGGLGKSAFGPGIKAGGPNYVAQFMKFREDDPPAVADTDIVATIKAASADDEALEVLLQTVTSSREPGEAARLGLRARLRVLEGARSYRQAWQREFSKTHDHFRLVGQDNLRRYLPFDEIIVRWNPADRLDDVLLRLIAARITGARALLSVDPGIDDGPLQWIDRITLPLAAGVEWLRQGDDQLADVVRSDRDGRVRFAGPEAVSATLRRAAADSGQWLADPPVLAVGRIELLWYLREQSLCHDYHRYGNLGARAGERRGPVE